MICRCKKLKAVSVLPVRRELNPRQRSSQATFIIHRLSNSTERLISVIRAALIDMTSLPPCVKAGEMLHATVDELLNVIQREKL